jgi:hypothetical protein
MLSQNSQWPRGVNLSTIRYYSDDSDSDFLGSMHRLDISQSSPRRGRRRLAGGERSFASHRYEMGECRAPEGRWEFSFAP